jgi:HSP20 family protein
MVSNPFYGGDAFREMRRIQSEMNRLFQSATSGWAGDFPAVNVYAGSEGAVITAELPGVKEDDLDSTVHRDTITLRGERKPQAESGSAYHRRERGVGSFARTFNLPFQVDPDRVDAEMRDGVLRLTLQRHESDRPKRIAVRPRAGG